MFFSVTQTSEWEPYVPSHRATPAAVSILQNLTNTLLGDTLLGDKT